MDQITLHKTKFLHPGIRQEVLDAYKYINNKLFGKPVRLRFSHSLRSFEEQDELYAQGRTKLFDSMGKRLNKVTNAKSGESIHNYGLAFDILLLIDTEKNGSFKTPSWDTKADFDKDGLPEWTEAVSYLKRLGWTWGGDWKSFPDYPHFEKTFGHTWKTLLRKYNSGDTFTESIDGKIYKWVNL